MSNTSWPVSLTGSAQASRPSTSTPPAYQQQLPTRPSTDPFSSLSSTAKGQASSGDNEEWTFASALPEAGVSPASSELTVTNSAVSVIFSPTLPSGPGTSLRILARFSNNTAQVISELTFQVAVSKVSNTTGHPERSQSDCICGAGILIKTAATVGGRAPASSKARHQPNDPDQRSGSRPG